MLRRLLIAAVGALAFVSLSHAETATIGSTKVELPQPPGYCALDVANASDARLKSLLTEMIAKGGNVLLGHHVDCKQLDAWRKGSGKLLDDFVQYQSRNVDVPFGAAEVSTTCKDLQQAGQILAESAVKTVQPIYEAASKSIRLNEMKIISATPVQDGTCYVSMLQRLRTEYGTEKTQLCVFSVHSVRDKLVFYYLFTLYTPGMDVAAAIERHKAHAKALQAANR